MKKILYLLLGLVVLAPSVKALDIVKPSMNGYAKIEYLGDFSMPMAYGLITTRITFLGDKVGGSLPIPKVDGVRRSIYLNGVWFRYKEYIIDSDNNLIRDVTPDIDLRLSPKEPTGVEKAGEKGAWIRSREGYADTDPSMQLKGMYRRAYKTKMLMDVDTTKNNIYKKLPLGLKYRIEVNAIYIPDAAVPYKELTGNDVIEYEVQISSNDARLGDFDKDGVQDFLPDGSSYVNNGEVVENDLDIDNDGIKNIYEGMADQNYDIDLRYKLDTSLPDLSPETNYPKLTSMYKMLDGVPAFMSGRVYEWKDDQNSVNKLPVNQYGILVLCDNDNDGIPNWYDLDSNNDGVPDALDGTKDVLISDLDNSPYDNPSFNGKMVKMITRNKPADVSAQGIPLKVCAATTPGGAGKKSVSYNENDQDGQSYHHFGKAFLGSFEPYDTYFSDGDKTNGGFDQYIYGVSGEVGMLTKVSHLWNGESSTDPYDPANWETLQVPPFGGIYYHSGQGGQLGSAIVMLENCKNDMIVPNRITNVANPGDNYLMETFQESGSEFNPNIIASQDLNQFKGYKKLGNTISLINVTRFINKSDKSLVVSPGGYFGTNYVKGSETVDKANKIIVKASTDGTEPNGIFFSGCYRNFFTRPELVGAIGGGLGVRGLEAPRADEDIAVDGIYSAWLTITDEINQGGLSNISAYGIKSGVSSRLNASGVEEEIPYNGTDIDKNLVIDGIEMGANGTMNTYPETNTQTIFPAYTYYWDYEEQKLVKDLVQTEVPIKLQRNPDVYATVEMYTKGKNQNSGRVLDDNFYSPTNGKFLYGSKEWQFFGVPVESVNRSDINGAHTIRKYDETYNGNIYINDPSQKTFYAKWKDVGNNEEMKAGLGYEITQETPEVITFTGKINNCWSELNLTAKAEDVKPNSQIVPSNANTFYDKVATRYGWGQNIVANSYTHPMAVGNLDFSNDPNDEVEHTAYVYNTGTFVEWYKEGISVPGYDGSAAVERTVAGSYSAYPALLGEQAGLPVISSMQGFLLLFTPKVTDYDYTTPNTGYRLINNPIGNKPNNLNAKVLGMMYNGLQKSPEKKIEPSYLKIGLVSKSTIDELSLYSVEGTTDRFDNGWDGRKSFGTPTAFIYSETADGDLSINTSNNISGKLITFRSNKDTDYELFLMKKNLDEDYKNLNLLDLETGIVTPLVSDTTIYRFRADRNNSTERRFKIVNSANITPEMLSKVAKLTVKYSENTIFTENFTDKSGLLQVTDLSGRMLMQRVVTKGPNSFTTKFGKGVYIIRLMAGKERTTLKILK